MNNGVAFEMIRDAMDDPAFFGRISSNLDAVLTERGFSDPADRAEIRRVMTALLLPESAADTPPFTPDGAATTLDELQQATIHTANAFKGGLRNTVEQIERGFQATMIMYTVAFYLGVGLILAAVAMAFVKQTALLPIVFGSLGMADVLAYFITSPPQDLQFSRARLAQLQAAFYNWFMNYANWNGVLADSSQRGNANVNLLKMVSTSLMEHTEKTMALIDRYCGSPRERENGKADK
jgi:hypothetical protein